MARRSHGDGSIVDEKKNGRKTGRKIGFFVMGTKPDGTMDRRKVIRNTQREVEAEFRKFKALRDAGVQDLARLTVGDYLTTWLETVVAVQSKPRTLEHYGTAVRLHFAPALGRLLLVELATSDVQKLVKALSAQHGATHVRGLLGVFKTALNHAVKTGLLVRNPCDAVVLPRAQRHEATPLDMDQLLVFLDAAERDPLRALWVTAAMLGLRRGELLGLQWGDIDHKRQTLKIQRAGIRVGNATVMGEPKTRTSRRMLPLPDKVYNALVDHSAGKDTRADALIFPDEAGGLLNPTRLDRRFKALLKRAGLPDIRLHDLRHSCASLLAALGVHPRVAMDILGHATIAMTANVYSHVFDESRRDVADRLEAALKGRKSVEKEADAT